MDVGRLDFSGSQVWTDERVAEFRRLWAAGIKTRDIALELGVSNGTVCGKARRLELPIRRHNQPKGPANPLWKGGRKASTKRSNQRLKAALKRDPLPPRPVIRRVKPGRICFLLGYRDSFS